MSILNKSSRTDIYFDLDMEFMDALELADNTFEQIAMVDRTNKPLKKYKWMEAIQKMVKWKGNREMHKLTGSAHEIANEDWATGIEIDRDDFEDDAEFGQVAQRIRDLADLGNETINDEVIAFYVGGFAATKGLTYDGQFLYDTDHTMAANGSGDSISNLGTAAFTTTALNAALVAIAGWTDPKGRKLKVKMTHILHGPSLLATMRTTFNVKTVTTGGDNEFFELLIPVLVPEITDAKWYLIDASKRARPVIVQIRRDPNLASPSTSMEDDKAFHTKGYEFGVDMTFGCGYGPWHLTWASNATT
jgi:phage major head subunit gpT-like protein